MCFHQLDGPTIVGMITLLVQRTPLNNCASVTIKLNNNIRIDRNMDKKSIVQKVLSMHWELGSRMSLRYGIGWSRKRHVKRCPLRFLTELSSMETVFQIENFPAEAIYMPHRKPWFGLILEEGKPHPEQF